MARVRRVLRHAAVGHTGTLDPLATGVLPLVVGHGDAARASAERRDKEYVAGVRLGLATETYDAAARVGPPPPAPRRNRRLTHDRARARPSFAAPTISCRLPTRRRKSTASRAYKLARRNEAGPTGAGAPYGAHLDARLVRRRPGRRLRVRCSAGFYVRSLAHDSGAARLRRAPRSAATDPRRPFRRAAAWRCDAVEEAGPAASQWLLPLDALLLASAGSGPERTRARRALMATTSRPSDLATHAERRHAAEGRWRLLDEAGRCSGSPNGAPAGFCIPSIVLV